MLIAEVSRKYDISADTLRYYERVGLIPAVHRRDNGIRDYDEGDLNWVEFIKCMRSAGIQVEALIEYVALYQQGDETNEARKEILVEQRAQLMQRMADMEATLERLNYKIDNYDRVMRNSIDMSKCKNSDG
ncbi:MerR family transcriptional regulator [Raoultibacter timonensis]|uniref:MerR family transcriptional regulator n=1 Tax=Raoultibacter timonensis TaxID=1907662 RepID=UPI0026DCA348|nr:MerR family transcriptional regulator [Raoultibacter timonensis]